MQKYNCISGRIRKIENVNDNLTFITLNPSSNPRCTLKVPFYKKIKPSFYEGECVDIITKVDGFFVNKVFSQKIEGLSRRNVTEIPYFRFKQLEIRAREFLG